MPLSVHTKVPLSVPQIILSLVLLAAIISVQVSGDKRTFDKVITISSTTQPNPDMHGFQNGFLSALSMVLVSEIGDKTFFIAAIMTAKYSRWSVFSGSLTALAAMTILSALLGGYVTTLIPPFYTKCVSTILFIWFGLKMLYDGLNMEEAEGVKEMDDVQTSLSQSDKMASETRSRLGKLIVLYSALSPIFVRAFTLTFSAEWGDRSQIATVALAATENLASICLGGVLGHAICTGVAVIGGRLIASRISVKRVTLMGALTFFGFAVSSIFTNFVEG